MNDGNHTGWVDLARLAGKSIECAPAFERQRYTTHTHALMQTSVHNHSHCNVAATPRAHAACDAAVVEVCTEAADGWRIRDKVGSSSARMAGM